MKILTVAGAVRAVSGVGGLKAGAGLCIVERGGSILRLQGNSPLEHRKYKVNNCSEIYC